MVGYANRRLTGVSLTLGLLASAALLAAPGEAARGGAPAPCAATDQKRASGKSPTRGGACPAGKPVRELQRRRKNKRRRRGATAPTAPVAPQTASAPPPAQPASTSKPNPAPNPLCTLGPGELADLVVPSSCHVVASDAGSNPDPIPFWGAVQAESATRHQHVPTGGDPHPTANGTAQGNASYRRMTVFDGDDHWGERAELGRNDNASGPTVLYREGQRRITFASIRMPASSPVSINKWRVVLQMKSAQPYNNPALASIFEMHVRNGYWIVQSNWEDVWYARAQQDTWTRFAFDVTYSQFAAVGSIKIYADLNGDGDAADPNEQSPRVNRPTLRAETAAGSPSPFMVGESIPSHLRSGIYHDPSFGCPSGCSAEIDNFQVVAVALPDLTEGSVGAAESAADTADPAATEPEDDSPSGEAPGVGGVEVSLESDEPPQDPGPGKLPTEAVTDQLVRQVRDPIRSVTEAVPGDALPTP